MSVEKAIQELTKTITVFGLACAADAETTAARMRADAHDLLDAALDQMQREIPKLPKLPKGERR